MVAGASGETVGNCGGPDEWDCTVGEDGDHLSKFRRFIASPQSREAVLAEINNARRSTGEAATTVSDIAASQ